MYYSWVHDGFENCHFDSTSCSKPLKPNYFHLWAASFLTHRDDPWHGWVLGWCNMLSFPNGNLQTSKCKCGSLWNHCKTCGRNKCSFSLFFSRRLLWTHRKAVTLWYLLKMTVSNEAITAAHCPCVTCRQWGDAGEMFTSCFGVSVSVCLCVALR